MPRRSHGVKDQQGLELGNSCKVVESRVGKAGVVEEHLGDLVRVAGVSVDLTRKPLEFENRSFSPAIHLGGCSNKRFLRSFPVFASSRPIDGGRSLEQWRSLRLSTTLLTEFFGI